MEAPVLQSGVPNVGRAMDGWKAGGSDSAVWEHTVTYPPERTQRTQRTQRQDKIDCFSFLLSVFSVISVVHSLFPQRNFA
jgi:hypothetical protein